MKKAFIGGFIVSFLIFYFWGNKMPLVVFKEQYFLKYDKKTIKSEYTGYSYYGNLVYYLQIPMDYKTWGSFGFSEFYFLRDNVIYFLNIPVESQLSYFSTAKTIPIDNCWYSDKYDTYAKEFANMNANKMDSIILFSGSHSYKIIDKFEYNKDTIMHIQRYDIGAEAGYDTKESQQAFFIGARVGFLGMYNFRREGKKIIISQKFGNVFPERFKKDEMSEQIERGRSGFFEKTDTDLSKNKNLRRTFYFPIIPTCP